MVKGTGSSTGNAMASLYDGVQAIVTDIAREHEAAGTPRVELTRPNDERFGDFATNVALMLAPVVRSDPRSVAAKVAERVRELPGVASVDVAGPGFVNITLDDAWFHDTLRAVVAAGSDFGGAVVTEPQHVSLEFVSANPTGPLVAASARHAAYGDSLARVLRFAGHQVDTEFYVNDTGNQVALFGQSIVARATGTDVPEEGYQGAYVADLARELTDDGVDVASADPTEVGRQAVALMVERARPMLERLRVHFDRFQSELELHEQGLVAEGIELVSQRGQTYTDDGATWLRTTAYGDDKDRTIVRSNGMPTYFAADIGYLLHKYRREHDHLVYVLGADHHGYVARLKAAAAALGYDADTTEVVIMQMVHLVEGGEQKKMSKRRGDFVTMEELLDRIGVDAARFMLVQRSHDQTVELDLELAVEQSNKNPVYYVQYAHARICSIMRKAQAELGKPADAAAGIDLAALSGLSLHASERRLVKRLAEFPLVVADAAERRAPHKLPHYAHDLASDFSQFYRDCRVVGDDVDPQTTELRLALAAASRTVLARALDLVGVSAPESM